MTSEACLPAWHCADNKLGEGTYGEVYAHGRYAMKVFKKSDGVDFANEAFYLEKFKGEKYILQSSSTSTNNQFKDKDIRVIATELMDGTLADYFKGTEPTPTRVKRTMRKLLQGLATMHHSRVVHCDIKPQNVLMNRDGSLKIGDLGCAAHQGTGTSINVVTRWYRPPELLFGYATIVDSKWDVWSAGCILGGLLLGRHMFQGRDEESMKIMVSEFQCDTTKWKVSDPDASDLLKHMLKAHPNERFSAKQALRHPYLTKIRV